MTRNNYVDLDLYGRGFDGIFGYGAEQENKRQALMKFKAMQRFKERVKPGEYIDLDLYGRGDPRVFGPNAHIHTQKHAQKVMEDVQRSKRDGHVNHQIIMFPAGLKAITRKARQLVRRFSSKNLETSELEDSQPSAGENTKIDHEGATEDRAIPPVGETQEEHATLEEPEPVQNAPRRFKSKLPSEEVPPHVEPGVVTRAVKSISSQDKTEEDKIGNMRESSRQALVVQPAHIAAHPSNASRSVLLPEESDSGSSNSAGSSGVRKTETERDADQTRRLAEPVSNASEAEVARGILVGSDEEFPLSFSTNVRDVGRKDYNSTSSEEDLLARQPNQERVLVDTDGRAGSEGKKIAGLFRSADSDSGSGQGGASDESREDAGAGPSRVADGYSSTEDEYTSSDEAGEVTEVVPSAAERAESDIKYEPRQGSEIGHPQPVLGTREASIINVVETGDLLLDNALTDDGNNDIQEIVEEKAVPFTTSGTGEAEDTVVDTTFYDADAETGNVVEQDVDDPSSSDGSESSEENAFGDQGEASMDASENLDSSAYMTDSDRSAEAESSSVVMSSSPDEDSDDIEIETSGDVEEESEEAEEVDDDEQEEQSAERAGGEEIEDLGEVRVVDSSDAAMTSDEENGNDAADENDGGAQAGEAQAEDGEAKSFWQRLPFFGTVAHGSWTVY